MMLCVVLKDGATVLDYDTIYYEITPRGELDIVSEDDVVLVTFNADAWLYVYREKDDDEEWPASLVGEEVPDGEGPNGEDIDPSVVLPSFLKNEDPRSTGVTDETGVLSEGQDR